MTTKELASFIHLHGDRPLGDPTLVADLVAFARSASDEARLDTAEGLRAEWLQAEAVETALRDVAGEILRVAGQCAAYDIAVRHGREEREAARVAYAKLRAVLDVEGAVCGICHCDLGHPELAIPTPGIGRGMAHIECVEQEDSREDIDW